MQYNSIFEKIKSWESVRRLDDMKYTGNLRDIFANLERLFTSLSSKETFDEQKAEQFIWFPARAIMAVIKYKIDTPEAEDNSVEMVSAATNFALNVYKNPSKIKKEINLFKERLSKTKNERVFDYSFSQARDGTTWASMNPVYSKSSATNLSEQFDNSDLLFIPLAQGGIAAGLDVFLRYLSISKSKNSTIYPIRYSRSKEKDAVPRVNTLEKEYLQKESRLKEIVIFDEDKSTGLTMKRAKNFFGENIFSGRELHGITNVEFG